MTAPRHHVIHRPGVLDANRPRHESAMPKTAADCDAKSRLDAFLGLTLSRVTNSHNRRIAVPGERLLISAKLPKVQARRWPPATGLRAGEAPCAMRDEAPPATAAIRSPARQAAFWR